ncbi:MAG: SpoIID/LytB domain-containing protein [Bacteroides sp.]|nr:SpoIID/LytB domain-containing protein [Bacteroides sp.]
MEREPIIRVGILRSPRIIIALHGRYQTGGRQIEGVQHMQIRQGAITWQGAHYQELLFEPVDEHSFFELKEITIGLGFHWQQQEDQRFEGALQVIVADETLQAINRIGVESYLESAISSEMKATASPEFLKSHAVIFRNWLLSQLATNREEATLHQPENLPETGTTYIRWYDKQEHTLFDVCADDHCQRYQGITRILSAGARQAVAATRGEVLRYGAAICDARFSKCCGGALEEYATCWEDRSYPYLTGKRDWKLNSDFPDLRQEKEAERWIHSRPPAFCNVESDEILSRVLNRYDRQTAGFFRWQVEYTQAELAALVNSRTPVEVGDIINLVPLERGSSGRIIRLKIIGTLRTLIIGKELEIRRILSTSHLYSSAFTVSRTNFTGPLPGTFTLSGAGWGHGVGLCQIGAAVMGEESYSYNQILTHYYPGSHIEKMYE